MNSVEYSPAELPISISPILESDVEFEYATDARSGPPTVDGSVDYNSSDDSSVRSASVAAKRQRTRQLKRKRLIKTRRARIKPNKSNDDAITTREHETQSTNVEKDDRLSLNPYKYFRKRWRNRCTAGNPTDRSPYASMKTGSVNVFVDKRGSSTDPPSDLRRSSPEPASSSQTGGRRRQTSTGLGAKLISAFGLLRYPMNLYTAYMLFTQLTGVSVPVPGSQSEAIISTVAENLPNIVDYIPTQLVSTLGVYAASIYRKV